VLSGAEKVGVVVVRGSGRTAPHLPVASAIALLAGTLVAHQAGGPALHADPVTGLGNRATFDRRMAEVLGDPARDVAVLLLDLDRFKQVNDTLGYQAGDRLLVEVTRRLRAVVPDGTTIARMGGDEFVIVPPPGIGWIQVRRLAQAVIDVLRAPYAGAEPSDLLACPASVGVTATSGRRVGASELLREADLALHQAKGSGRDRYVIFDDVLRSRAQTRHRTERRLREALEAGLLTLQYQPIVDFADGRVAGAEALVRVRDPDGERLLTPEAFISVAEDTGLIVDLDCWVIDTALAQVAEWAARSATPQSVPWVAINVSPRSMEHHRVIRRLLDTVRTGVVPNDRIRIELTEHSFLGAVPARESALRQLLGSGIRVGIDDFGTGYSALAYLQRFDLDFMKIDRSFVAAVGNDERADAVVTAIVDLAHAHGMRVTAEGVETPRQARRLREIGCDYAQGYHFGRPGEPDRVIRRQPAG
jgi:diguanylate cyclase (GGDEF)-like protein